MGFLRDVEKYDAEQAARADHSFETKMLNRVCSELGIEVPADLKHDSTFGFEWLNEGNHFPVRMCSRRIHAHPVDLFQRMTATKLFDTYIKELEDHGHPTMAMFFMLDGIGASVIHNWWGLEHVSGYTRLVRRAASEINGIIVEPIDSFLKSLKAKGVA